MHPYIPSCSSAGYERSRTMLHPLRLGLPLPGDRRRGGRTRTHYMTCIYIEYNSNKHMIDIITVA